MRGLVCILLLALLVPVVAAFGQSSGPRLRAVALVASGDAGAHHGVSVRSAGAERRATGGVDDGVVKAADGESVVRTTDAGATASAVARSVNVLSGRVTAYGVRRTARAMADGVTRSGRVEGLKIDGDLIGTVTEKRTIPVSGLGRVLLNTGGTGLRVILEDGTDLRIAVADASVRVPPAVTPTPTATGTPTATPTKNEHAAKKAKLKRRAAPRVPRRLTAAGFAFPVYGDSVSFGKTFGAVRAKPIVTHQGVDIFGDFGTPVVAVVDGTISKVGTLPISGNRLWITSASGDAFFYAHLSAFSPQAVDGAKVKAGTVLGFVGNTGDAEPTPPHLHFEVHPGGEEEDAVDPYPLLTAWRGRRDVPAGSWLQHYGPDTTERPGALVAVRDFIAE